MQCSTGKLVFFFIQKCFFSSAQRWLIHSSLGYFYWYHRHKISVTRSFHELEWHNRKIKTKVIALQCQQKLPTLSFPNRNSLKCQGMSMIYTMQNKSSTVCESKKKIVPATQTNDSSIIPFCFRRFHCQMQSAHTDSIRMCCVRLHEVLHVGECKGRCCYSYRTCYSFCFFLSSCQLPIRILIRFFIMLAACINSMLRSDLNLFNFAWIVFYSYCDGGHSLPST